MAELPSSWNLEVKKEKGKAEVWGRDDLGKQYKVRTCDHAEITERDVSEIAAVDRERTTAGEYISNLVRDGRRDSEYRESQFFDDLTDAAGPVVHAGLERQGTTIGYSRTYARNFDSWLKSL